LFEFCITLLKYAVGQLICLLSYICLLVYFQWYGKHKNYWYGSVNFVSSAFMWSYVNIVTCGHSCIMIVAVPWLGHFPAFHCGGPVLIPGQSVWDLWWINWQWNRCFSKYFSFDLSVLFHQYAMLFFHLSATNAT